MNRMNGVKIRGEGPIVPPFMPSCNFFGVKLKSFYTQFVIFTF